MSNVNFKVGDKVKCVDKGISKLLRIGEVYTISQVEEVDGCMYVRLNEVKQSHDYSVNRFVLVEYEHKQVPKFKNGDTVNTKYGVFELLQKCPVGTWLGYQNGFDGHSGSASFGDKYKYSEYKNQCWWFEESEIEIVENSISKSNKSYREMSPDTIVKIKVDDHEFDVPLKEMLLLNTLTGSVSDYHRTDTIFEHLNKLFGDDYMCVDGYVEFKNADKYYKEYFKPFCDKQHEVEGLKKEIEHQEALLLDMKKKLSEIS